MSLGSIVSGFWCHLMENKRVRGQLTRICGWRNMIYASHIHDSLVCDQTFRLVTSIHDKRVWKRTPWRRLNVQCRLWWRETEQRKEIFDIFKVCECVCEYTRLNREHGIDFTRQIINVAEGWRCALDNSRATSDELHSKCARQKCVITFHSTFCRAPCSIHGLIQISPK